jgi:hypothetical protein
MLTSLSQRIEAAFAVYAAEADTLILPASRLAFAWRLLALSQTGQK